MVEKVCRELGKWGYDEICILKILLSNVAFAQTPGPKIQNMQTC